MGCFFKIGSYIQIKKDSEKMTKLKSSFDNVSKIIKTTLFGVSI
jgi:hypothetical protein